MTNHIVGEYRNLVTHVLSNGAADGTELLSLTNERNPLEVLYLATRRSQYAETWRQLFGQVRTNVNKATSILGLTVLVIADCVGQGNGQIPLDFSLVQEDINFCLRIIANCCADNNANRKEVAISCNGIRWLLELLEFTVDADILIQTLYNLCVDYDQPASKWGESPLSQIGDSVPVTETEECLATCGRTKPIYSGAIQLLNQQLLERCSVQVLDCLAELVEMACRPITLEQTVIGEAGSDQSIDITLRLLASDGGLFLANSSLTGRLHVCRALLAVSASQDVKTHLAASGDIFPFATMAQIPPTLPEDIAMEDDEDIKETTEAFQAVQDANVKLLYDICQTPQFGDPPKYGIARLSMIELFNFEMEGSQYTRAVALIMLYGFVNNDVRASLLTCEGLIQVLTRILAQETEKTVLNPAIGLASKVAVTWRLRRDFVEAGIVPAVKHLLVDPGLGLEIPINTIIFLEILVKGQPEHLVYLVTASQGQSGSGTIMMEIVNLFERGNDVISLEIGRLMIEMCSTAALDIHGASETENSGLGYLLMHTNAKFWVNVLVFMSTKAQAMNAQNSSRVWFAMGVFSTHSHGRLLLASVLQDTDVQSNLRHLLEDENSPVAQNVRFMMHNLSRASGNKTEVETELNNIFAELQLG